METRIALILKAATDLFSQYGIKGVTMDQIARKVGVSKKSIYERFADKEELLTEIVRQNLEDNKAAFDHINATETNPVIKIARIYETLLRQQKEYHPSLYWTMSRSFPNSLKVIDVFQKDMSFVLLKNLLDEAMKKNIIHEKVNIQVVCELYHWFLQKVVSGDFYELLNRDFTATFNHLILYNLRGLLTKEHCFLLDDYGMQAPA